MSEYPMHPQLTEWEKKIKAEAEKKLNQAVNHPSHYTSHPSGIECIDVVEHMGFCVGNAIKYLWRAGQKGDQVEDLKKARWYVDREISRLEKASKKS